MRQSHTLEKMMTNSDLALGRSLAGSANQIS